MLKIIYNKKGIGIISFVILASLIFSWLYWPSQKLQNKTQAEGEVQLIPQTKGNLPDYGNVKDIIFSTDGNRAYMSSKDFGVVVVDTTNKEQPEVLGTQNSLRVYDPLGPGIGEFIALSADEKTVFSWRYGIDVVDVSNPRSPKTLANIPGVSSPAVKGNYLYTGASNAFKIFDISSPAAPRLVNTVNLTGLPMVLEQIDEYLVMSLSNSNTMLIYNLTNPIAPTLTGTYIASGSISGGFDVGKYNGSRYVYLADYGTDKLQIVDISTPNAPQKKATLSAFSVKYVFNNGWLFGTSCVLGETCIYNVSNPDQIVTSARMPNGSIAADISGDYFYTNNYSGGGINVTNINDPLRPGNAISFTNSKKGNNLAVSGNTAIITTTTAGTDIVNVSNPAEPKVIATIPGNSIDVAIKGNYAYLCTGTGLDIFDISTPANPVLKKSIVLPEGFPRSITLIDNYAVLGLSNGGVIMADLVDPINPILGNTLSLGGLISDVTTGKVGNKNYAFVANGHLPGLQIIDLSDWRNLNKVGQYSFGSGAAIGVAFQRNTVYVTQGMGKFQPIDVSTPSNPTRIGFGAQDHAYGIELYGKYAFVGSGAVGLTIVDISNPVNIPFGTSYRQIGSAYAPVISGSKIYVTDNTAGLVIYEFDPGAENITISKSVDKNSVKYQDEVTFTIKIENKSLNVHNDIVISDPIPSNTHFVGTTIDGVTEIGADSERFKWDGNTNVLTWKLSRLGPIGSDDGTHTITLKLRYVGGNDYGTLVPLANASTPQAMIQAASKVEETAQPEESQTPSTPIPSTEPTPTPASTSTPSPVLSSSSSPSDISQDTVNLSGVLVDSRTKKPLKRATVAVFDGKTRILKTRTNSKGKYTLTSNKLEPDKEYSLKVSKGLSYDQAASVMFSADSATTAQDMAVKKVSVFSRIWLALRGLFK